KSRNVSLSGAVDRFATLPRQVCHELEQPEGCVELAIAFTPYEYRVIRRKLFKVADLGEDWPRKGRIQPVDDRLSFSDRTIEGRSHQAQATCALEVGDLGSPAIKSKLHKPVRKRVVGRLRSVKVEFGRHRCKPSRGGGPRYART